MWRQTICILSWLTVSCLLHGQLLETLPKQFELFGTIPGLNGQTIYLQYTTEANGHKIDSTKIVLGNFSFQSEVLEPTLAELSLEPNFSGYDLNYATIYIEPGEIRIIANKDSLRFLKSTKAGRSQQENEQLLQEKKRDWLRLVDLRVKMKKQTQESLHAKKTDSAEFARITDSMQKQEELFQRKMLAFDSFFIVNNPNSYVAAQMLLKNMKIEPISLYPADALYDKMPVGVKNSRYGKGILWHIDKAKQLPTGSKAPEISGLGLNGEPIKLSNLEHRSYVLLDFWASWCWPCRQLTPTLKWLHRTYQKSGLEIISVAIDDKEKEWRFAIEKDGSDSWSHVFGDSTTRDAYKANWLPTFFLLDKSGRIIGRYGLTKGYGERSVQDLYKDVSILFQDKRIHNQ